MHKFTTIIRRSPIFLMLMLISTGAAASGGLGLPSGSAGAPVRQVDELYEAGKQIYKGRTAGAEKIAYCVKVDGELKKLKRSTIKPFKGGSREDFALALFDCEQPDRLALTSMQRDQVPVVLYYLEKRFRLNLQDA